MKTFSPSITCHRNNTRKKNVTEHKTITFKPLLHSVQDHENKSTVYIHRLWVHTVVKINLQT